MPMIDLKITKEEAKKEQKKYATLGPSNGERYSYGTRVTLDDAELKKLGIKDLPAVGAEMMFEAKAKVISSRQSASETTNNRSIELQITHMEFEDAAQETEEDKLENSKLAKKIASM